MTASACLTLALIHGFIWCRQRRAWANLLFTLTALGTAALAAGELAMMRSQNSVAFASAVRWIHVPVWVILVSLVGFVRLDLRAGRSWLAWIVCTLRTASLLLNFLVGENLNYLHVTGLRPVCFFGESVSVGQGVVNPWMLVGQLSLWSLVIFVADAAVSTWRRGEHRKAVMVGGSIVLFVLAGAVQAVLVFWEIVHWPVTASLFYLGIVAAMSYELSREALIAAQLARDLRDSEQRMTLAADAANLGIWVRDLPRNTIWATAKWRDLFAFTSSEPLNFTHFLQRLHSDDRGLVAKALSKANNGDNAYATEYRVVLPDGRMRWIASQGRFEFDVSGKPARVLGVSLDITHRKQAELEIRSQREQVAHLMRVATLGELSSALAHELNQPLTAILSNAQAAQRFLAQETSDPREIGPILRDIVADDQRACEVIHRLRLLFKKGEIQPQALDATKLIEDVLKLMNGDLSARAVSVAAACAANLPPIHGDPVQLQQVLINLILNGAEAMSQTPAACAADYRMRPSRQRQLRPDFRRRYRRRYSNRSGRKNLRTLSHHQTTGTGAGLVPEPLHHRRAHRPALGHQPAGRRGDFLLHRARIKRRYAMSVHMSVQPTPPTVFLVDDDPSVLCAIGRLLRSAGLNVSAFQSPREFLDQQNPDTPGCLVLDVTMPGLTGLELQQVLSRMENRLPIIFLTGHGDIPMSVRAMKSGAVDFLSKPCHDEELLQAVSQALTRDQRLRQQQMQTRAIAALFATLTPREYQVMLGVVAGQLNKQIAAELGTAEKTIKVHRGRVMDKLQVSSVADLVRLSERAGVRVKSE